ncbi:hypothetical protein E4U58_005232 [Claviceps cyperi]|nr:hypothetical protein E4U58_005232 [Claviceps cyperi]
MSAGCLNPIIQVASCRGTLIKLIDSIENLPTLYVDLEGCQLSRNGTISIVTIYATTLATAYIVDVHKLGKSAFTTANTTGTTLKAIFESAKTKKVIFDVRNDSDALFHHFQISLQGVQDLQLMELAARRGNRRFVAGLAKCIQNDSPISKAEKMKWDQLKKSTISLFEPKRGGRYEVFNERPFRDGILEYCAGDVVLLPGLYDVYDGKLTTEWRKRVRAATLDRIRLSQKIEEMARNWAAMNFVKQRKIAMIGCKWCRGSARDCIGGEEDKLTNGSRHFE